MYNVQCDYRNLYQICEMKYESTNNPSDVIDVMGSFVIYSSSIKSWERSKRVGSQHSVSITMISLTPSLCCIIP